MPVTHASFVERLAEHPVSASEPKKLLSFRLRVRNTRTGCATFNQVNGEQRGEKGKTARPGNHE